MSDMLKLRQVNDSGILTRSIEVEFEGEWVDIALVGTMGWTDDKQGKNKRYREFAMQVLELFVRAPEIEQDARALALLFKGGEYYTAEAYNIFEKHGKKYLDETK